MSSPEREILLKQLKTILLLIRLRGRSCSMKILRVTAYCCTYSLFLPWRTSPKPSGNDHIHRKPPTPSPRLSNASYMIHFQFQFPSTFCRTENQPNPISKREREKCAASHSSFAAGTRFGLLAKMDRGGQE